MDETRFYYSTDGTDSLGPVPVSGLRKLYEDKVITIDSFLCREGESTWEPFDPASLPARTPVASAPAPAPEPEQVKTPAKLRPKLQPEPKTEVLPAFKPKTDFKTVQEAKPKSQAKPQSQPQPQAQLAREVVVQFDESEEEGWENSRFKIIAWGICGFVAFDTALFLTWQRPSGPHSVSSTIFFFLGQIFFVFVIPVLISRVIPRPFRYRSMAGLTVLLALIFIGLRFALPSGKSSVASVPTPATNAPPEVSSLTPPPDTNAASSAALETSSSATNAASLALPPPPPPEPPATNAAPAVTAVNPPATNAAPIAPVVPPSVPETNAAPAVAITPAPATNAAPVVPPAPPTPPVPPPMDPAAVARDLQKVTDALADKVKASAAAEAACPNFNPATITTHENVSKRQAAITAWQTTQNDVLTFLQNYDDRVRDAVAHENLNPKDLADTVADARKKAQVDQLITLWQLKIKLSSDHLARLIFLDKNWDHWSGKTGKLVFDDKTVLDDYTKFLTPLQEDVKGIADIQKQLTQ